MSAQDPLIDWRQRVTLAVIDEQELLVLVEEIVHSPLAPAPLVKAAVNVRNSLRHLLRLKVRATAMQREIATLRTAQLLKELAEPS